MTCERVRWLGVNLYDLFDSAKSWTSSLCLSKHYYKYTFSLRNTETTLSLSLSHICTKRNTSIVPAAAIDKQMHNISEENNVPKSEISPRFSLWKKMKIIKKFKENRKDWNITFNQFREIKAEVYPYILPKDLTECYMWNIVQTST